MCPLGNDSAQWTVSSSPESDRLNTQAHNEAIGENNQPATSMIKPLHIAPKTNIQMRGLIAIEIGAATWNLFNTSGNERSQMITEVTSNQTNHMPPPDRTRQYHGRSAASIWSRRSDSSCLRKIGRLPIQMSIPTARKLSCGPARNRSFGFIASTT